MEDFLNSQKDTYKLNVERELFKSQNVRFNFDSIKFLIPLCATYTEDKAVCMCRLIFVMQLIDVRKIIRM